MWSRLLYRVARYVCSHTRPRNCIQRSAVTLSYQIYGDDHLKYDKDHLPIFLLHDLLGSKKDWSVSGKVLNDITGRPVVAVDLRNHGSSPHAASHKYTEMAEDLLAMFEKMELKTVSLVGFNMGGRASMTLALVMVGGAQPKLPTATADFHVQLGSETLKILRYFRFKDHCTCCQQLPSEAWVRYPEKVASLLIIDISPVSSCTHLLNIVPKIMSAMKSLDLKGLQKIKDARKEAKVKLRNLVADDSEMNSILENLGVIKSTGSIGWICNLDVLINNFDFVKGFPPSLLSKAYDGPTLFVGGQHSEYIPPDDLPLIRELFPRAVVKYIPKTGHNLQMEDPKSFLELATTFLNTNPHSRRYW